jgi:hypothetical protein
MKRSEKTTSNYSFGQKLNSNNMLSPIESGTPYLGKRLEILVDAKGP